VPSSDFRALAEELTDFGCTIECVGVRCVQRVALDLWEALRQSPGGGSRPRRRERPADRMSDATSDAALAQAWPPSPPWEPGCGTYTCLDVFVVREAGIGYYAEGSVEIDCDGRDKHAGPHFSMRLDGMRVMWCIRPPPARGGEADRADEKAR